MKKTILILAANPKGTTQLNLTTEVEQIEQELQRLQRDQQFILKPYWAVTPAELRHALLDHKPHFVHFSGHGAAEQGIVLENDAGEIQLLDTDALAKVFEPYANRIECVILNACYSALQASAIVKHIHYVIGMNKPIQDNAAIQFATVFYDALAASESIETAFKMGRYSIQAAMPTSEEHLKPVLKTRYDKTAWNVPISPNPFFTGRESLLRQLQETLHFRHAAALSGLGGMGKTQTAAHYAIQHRHEYQAVLWVLADTVEALKSGLAALAHTLDLPERNLEGLANFEGFCLKAVQDWLATHHDWLLILDNADDMSVLSLFDRGYLGHLLLTTRAQTTEPFAQRVEINALSLDEGITFLLRRATDIPRDELEYAFADHKEAKPIVEVLDSLPLALDQAGAYIRETQSGLTGYLERYHTYAPKLLAKRGTLLNQHDHPDAVAKTWLLSFDKIVNENPTAADVLSLCAFLHPDKIPEEIFQALDPIGLDDALAVILKYSLLHREPKTKMLSIHRVVQLILKHGMDETEQRSWAEKAVRAVNSVFPSVKFETWALCERLLPCAQTCAALIDEWVFEFEEAAFLLHQTAFYLNEKAEYSQAKPMYERALAIWEKVHGKEHPLVAQSLSNLAALYNNQGAYEQALPLYRRALAIDEKVYGKEHPDVATDINSLALLYYAQGAYEQAKLLNERALAIREKVFDKEHPEVAASLNNLAELYKTQGAYEQAKPFYQRALAIWKKVHGNEHPNVAASLNNLAKLYKTQGAYEQAKQLNERALAIWEKVYGKEHPDVATSLNNIAELYRAQGAYEQALPLYGRALAIREKMLGKEHSEVATSLNNLAELYRVQGAYEQAKPLYKRALAIWEKVHGKEYPLVASSLNNLALLYKAQGAYEQALPLYKRALAIWEKVHGKEHPLVATSLNNIAGLYGAQGAYEQALRLYERALAIDEKVYGKEHPDVAIDLSNLALLYDAQCAYEQAKPLYEQALKIFKQVYKPNHPNVRVVSENYARLLEEMEKR